MLKTTAVRFKKLKELQPQLVRSKNKISGCFYLSATYAFNSRCEEKSELRIFPYNCTCRAGDPGFIYEYFYISATLTSEKEYLHLRVFEIDGKLDSWKRDIPSKYWHLYKDGFFCLGKPEELKKCQNRFEGKFERYFVYIISQFLYHMTYIKRHGIEPWEGHRHGLSKFFEDVSRLNLSNAKERPKFIRYLASYFLKEWEKLISVMLPYAENKLEITYNSPCPFCLLDKNNQKTGKCVIHKEDIERFNQVAKTVFKNRPYKAKVGYIKFENFLITARESISKRMVH